MAGFTEVLLVAFVCSNFRFGRVTIFVLSQCWEVNLYVCLCWSTNNFNIEQIFVAGIVSELKAMLDIRKTRLKCPPSSHQPISSRPLIVYSAVCRKAERLLWIYFLKTVSFVVTLCKAAMFGYCCVPLWMLHVHKLVLWSAYLQSLSTLLSLLLFLV